MGSFSQDHLDRGNSLPVCGGDSWFVKMAPSCRQLHSPGEKGSGLISLQSVLACDHLSNGIYGSCTSFSWTLRGPTVSASCFWCPEPPCKKSFFCRGEATRRITEGQTTDTSFQSFSQIHFPTALGPATVCFMRNPES